MATTRPKMPTQLPTRAETNLGRGALCPFMKGFQIDAKRVDAAGYNRQCFATDFRYAITSCSSASVNLNPGIFTLGSMAFLGFVIASLRKASVFPAAITSMGLPRSPPTLWHRAHFL